MLAERILKGVGSLRAEIARLLAEIVKVKKEIK
ncbi:uncharacterized protein G2W53_001792 [Senna tora]|uniref:Uncharacterized protein n=1 Tax=Senna tora TaxID=362788 RepID=A0A834XGY1_9FABA|nr:uncharacterized protein G2W53_001792 [Senna tora]